MKMNKSIKLFFVLATFSTSGLYAQKMNETGAALSFQDFKSCLMQAMQTGDTTERAMNSCMESLDKAKEYVDLAAANEKTMNSGKTHFYRAQIYGALLQMHADDSTYVNQHKDEYGKIMQESLKKAYEDPKTKKDVEDMLNMQAIQLNAMAKKFTDDKKFKEAAQMYEAIAESKSYIGKVDSISYYNAGVMYQNSEEYGKAADQFKKLAEMGYHPAESYANAIRNYVDAKELDSVKPLLDAAIAKYPTNKEVLLSGVNYYLGKNDMNSAKELMDKALQQDPNNKVLLYNIGTISLNNKDYARAEEVLQKAIQIDPNYDDAYYQLGAVYVNKYAEMSEKLYDMNPNDPKYKELDTEAKATIRKAVAPLEKYLEKHPDDRATLLNMTKIYRSIGDNAKAVEYKQRADNAQ